MKNLHIYIYRPLNIFVKVLYKLSLNRLYSPKSQDRLTRFLFFFLVIAVLVLLPNLVGVTFCRFTNSPLERCVCLTGRKREC